MCLGKNIHDAFEIVAETYENVDKLMRFLKDSKDGGFVHSSKRFLRQRSDLEIEGWYLNSFILLFQNSNDKLMSNKWRKGPIYVLEINLNPSLYDEPMVNLAKYEYSDNLSSWNEGITSGEHRIFFNPLYNDSLFEGEDDFDYAYEITDEV